LPLEKGHQRKIEGEKRHAEVPPITSMKGGDLFNRGSQKKGMESRGGWDRSTGWERRGRSLTWQRERRYTRVKRGKKMSVTEALLTVGGGREQDTSFAKKFHMAMERWASGRIATVAHPAEGFKGKDKNVQKRKGDKKEGGYDELESGKKKGEKWLPMQQTRGVVFWSGGRRE